MKALSYVLFLLLLSTPLVACGGGGGGSSGGTVVPVLRTVTNHDDSGPGSLRDTIADAGPDEWVVFDASLPTGTVNLLSSLIIDKPVVIGGLSGTLQRHRVSGQGSVRVFEMQSGSSLELRDLEVFDGSASDGGAIDGNQVSVVLTRVQFVSNHASSAGGGAVSIFEGQLTATDCAFTANTANWGGAISVQATEVTLDRCGFYLNSADTTVGGAFHAAQGSNVRILNTTFDSNMATNPVNGGGGAIALISGNDPEDATYGLIRSSTVTGNSAASIGGGIYVVHQGAASELDMSQTILAENAAPSAADIHFGAGAAGSGANNLIGVGDGSGVYWNGLSNNIVGDPVTPADPMLLAAAFAPGGRVIRVPQVASPARDHVPAGQSQDLDGAPLTVDERGMPRNPAGATDVGAIEE